MNPRFTNFAKALLRRAGFVALRHDTWEQILAQSELQCKPNVKALADRLSADTLMLLSAAAKSRSQLGQELVALALNDFKCGYFVEFGATDGLSLSNTASLERDHGWSGILAEPGREWHTRLSSNRSCQIDYRAVHWASGEQVDFIPGDELGTIKGFESLDYHASMRQKRGGYKVETVSLEDLLGAHGAPNRIEYLSVDTEGTEYEILRNFDFSKYEFQFISVEHNYAPWAPELVSFLESKGYTPVLEEVSHFESWFVGPGMTSKLR